MRKCFFTIFCHNLPGNSRITVGEENNRVTGKKPEQVWPLLLSCTVVTQKKNHLHVFHCLFEIRALLQKFGKVHVAAVSLSLKLCRRTFPPLSSSSLEQTDAVWFVSSPE